MYRITTFRIVYANISEETIVPIPLVRSTIEGQTARERIRAGYPVIGPFVKSASYQTMEILGLAGLDHAVIDAEHAPFDRAGLDRMIVAAGSSGLTTLVRVPSHDPAFINSCLDLGADGVLVPHVRSAADATAIVDAVKYGRGKRGFSPSGRAGRYGSMIAGDYRAMADATSLIWCQIEDAEALSDLDEIAAIDDIDCLFIGPADLSLSLGAAGASAPSLRDAVETIAGAGRRHRRPVGIFVRSSADIAPWLALGITVFVCGSDQGILLSGASALARDLEAIARDRMADGGTER